MVLIEFRALNVDPAVAALCNVGDDVVIWDLPHIDFMCFYAPGTGGGGGRIAKLPKAKIPGLTAYLDRAIAEVRAIEGTTCIIDIKIEVDERDFFRAQDAGWPPAKLPF